MILLMGASSQIGYFLLQHLSYKHYPALAVSRRSPPAWGISRDICWMQHDLDEEALPSDASILISAGALRHAAAAIHTMPRLNHVIAISSSSIVNKQGTGNAEEQQVINELLEAENHLVANCEEREIALTILRPTLVYGCGLDRNLSRVVDWLNKRAWFPISGKARGLRQPVHADDIAQLCVACFEMGSMAAGEYDLGGGSTIPYKEMVRRTASAIDRPLRFLPLPEFLLAKLLDMASALPGLRGLNGAMIKRQNQDLVVDHQLAEQRLQWRPRAFEPDGECFQPPALRK